MDGALVLLYQLVLPHRTASWAQSSLLATIYPLILVMMAADDANPWRATFELIGTMALASLFERRCSPSRALDSRPQLFS